jgi:DNA-binding NtrC family response regulator
MVLVVDDEENIREGLRSYFKMDGFDVITAVDGEDGLEKFKTIGADAIILDLKMPKLGGMDFLKKTRNISGDVPVVILTGHGGVDDAVEAMKQGAYDFVTKPPNLEQLSMMISRAITEAHRKNRVENLSRMVDEKYNFENIIGNSPPISRVLDMIKQVAPTDATALVTGGSGTGKELIASAIHTNSKRKDKPFIKVHCAALPENLLESELFGHEKGAFTGAIARKRGRFELADGGTIFLDEIGEISPVVQVKLLRVLQEQEFERLGGEETLKVNIRIIAATNKNLRAEVEAGRFREDLFFRLNVINIHIPELKERPADIPLLANFFMREFSKKHSKKIDEITTGAMKLLEKYDWPGNVRELQNVIENAVVLLRDKVIDINNLPDNIREFEGKKRIVLEVGLSLSEVEKQVILSTLDAVNGNKSKAARILGIGRKTLLRKLESY